MDQEVVDEEQESTRRNASFREKWGPQNRSAFQEKSSRNLVLLKVRSLTLPADPLSRPEFRERQAFSVRLEVAKNFPLSQVLLKVRSVTALGEPVIGRWGIMGEARNGLHNKFWIKKLCKLVKIGKSAPDLRPGADE